MRQMRSLTAYRKVRVNCEIRRGISVLERRTFVRVLGGTILSLPYSSEAASEAEVATVGVLMGLAKDEEAEARAKAFEEGLKREGWSVGRNLHLEYRYADGDRALMQTLAIELVRLKCDCILAQSTPVVAALKKVTRTYSNRLCGCVRSDW